MSGDVGLLRLPVFGGEVAAQRFRIEYGFLNCPATRGVSGLRDRISLIGEDSQYSGQLSFFVRDCGLAVSMAVHHQAAIPILRNVDAELGAVQFANFGSGLRLRGRRTNGGKHKNSAEKLHVGSFESYP